MISPELSRRLGVAFFNLVFEDVNDLNIKNEMVEWLSATQRDIQTLEDLPESIQQIVAATEANDGTRVRPSEVLSNG